MKSYSHPLNCAGAPNQATHQNQLGNFVTTRVQANPEDSNSIRLEQGPSISFFRCKCFCYVPPLENHWAKKRARSPGFHLSLLSKGLFHVPAPVLSQEDELGKGLLVPEESLPIPTEAGRTLSTKKLITSKPWPSVRTRALTVAQELEVGDNPRSGSPPLLVSIPYLGRELSGVPRYR